jgi:hypothetical protein
MDWKAKLERAKGALDQDSQRKLDEHWPKIQQIFQEKVGPAALAAAKDDATMTAAIKVVYLALPFPVHLVVKEPAFVEYCLAHRDRLLPGTLSAGTNPAS